MAKYETVPENGAFRKGWFQMGKQVLVSLALYDQNDIECDMKDSKQYGKWAMELDPEQQEDDVEGIKIQGDTTSCWYTPSVGGGGLQRRLNVLFRPEPNTRGWTEKQSSQDGTSRTIQLKITTTVPAESSLWKAGEGDQTMEFSARAAIKLYTGAPCTLAFDGDKSPGTFSCDGPLEIPDNVDPSLGLHA